MPSAPPTVASISTTSRPLWEPWEDPGRPDSSASSSWSQRLELALQEVALGGVLGAGDRRLVRHRRLAAPAQAAEQVGADGVEQVVALEVEAVDEGERRIRSLDLRDRAVEGHDRARGE